MPWQDFWLAALTVHNLAQKVFGPGARPPGELMPLVEPLHRLGDAFRAKDNARIRACATDLVADSAVIDWACQENQPKEIRDLGYMMAYLAKTLET
jgi:hypothetical protein